MVKILSTADYLIIHVGPMLFTRIFTGEKESTTEKGDLMTEGEEGGVCFENGGMHVVFHLPERNMDLSAP